MFDRRVRMRDMRGSRIDVVVDERTLHELDQCDADIRRAGRALLGFSDNETP